MRYVNLPFTYFTLLISTITTIRRSTTLQGQREDVSVPVKQTEQK